MSYDVRRAEPGDVAAIAIVHSSSWERAYEHLLPGPFRLPWSGRNREERWRKLIVSDRGGLKVLVATKDEDILGVCVATSQARDEPESGEIAALYVDPANWRSGIGTGLMKAALAEITNGRVYVWIFSENERGADFYETLGFVWDGHTQLHPSGLEERRMRLDRESPGTPEPDP